MVKTRASAGLARVKVDNFWQRDFAGEWQGEALLFQSESLQNG